jgi:gluconolactonase
MAPFSSVLIALTCSLAVSPIHGPLQKLCTGFVYTEGPVCDAQGNLYFTDYKDGCGKIYRLDPTGQLSVFVENSNRANGLKINAAGEIVACQMNGRVAAYSPDGSSIRVLTDSFGGRRYNAPNDLGIDCCGGIYFTDPFFGAPRPCPPQRIAAVYYLALSGEVTRIIDNLRNPNGIVLSPDGTTLYVVPTMERHVMAYPVLAPGQLGPGRKFCRLAPSQFPFFPGGDGATVDDAGNLYVATLRGVQIFDSAGHLLDILCLPERPSNLTFGPHGRTLYITAGHSVYAIEMDGE